MFWGRIFKKWRDLNPAQPEKEMQGNARTARSA